MFQHTTRTISAKGSSSTTASHLTFEHWTRTISRRSRFVSPVRPARRLRKNRYRESRDASHTRELRYVILYVCKCLLERDPSESYMRYFAGVFTIFWSRIPAKVTWAIFAGVFTEARSERKLHELLCRCVYKIAAKVTWAIWQECLLKQDRGTKAVHWNKKKQFYCSTTGKCRITTSVAATPENHTC